MTTELSALLGKTSAVLLDFDGPVCDLYGSGVKERLTAELRALVSVEGLTVPAEVTPTHDPLDLLRYVDDHKRDLTNRVEDALIEGELAAVDIINATPGGDDVIRAAHDAALPLVVVSNNSSSSIEKYLHAHRLHHYVLAVVGRAYGQPREMKPNRTPVRHALAILGAAPASCVMIGDSTTDMQVAKATGLMALGYAKTPERRPQLIDAGADCVTDDMVLLAAELSPPRTPARRVFR